MRTVRLTGPAPAGSFVKPFVGFRLVSSSTSLSLPRQQRLTRQQCGLVGIEIDLTGRVAPDLFANAHVPFARDPDLDLDLAHSPTGIALREGPE